MVVRFCWRDPNRNWSHSDASEHRGCSEVANDIYGDLMNFWRVLRDNADFAKFRRYVECMPFSETGWTDAKKALEVDSEPNWRRAADFFICCRQSMSGRMDCFAPLSRRRTRRGMNEQASAWMSCIDGLELVHQRLQSVVILNSDAVDVIRQQDGEMTLFYVDPPYWPDSRTAPDVYKHEMSTDEHLELLRALSEVTGKFILSGYHCEAYDSFASTFGWRCQEIEMPNSSGKGPTKNRRVECLWSNF